MTLDNIKSHKNKGSTLSLENTFFEKPQRKWGEIDLPPPAVLGLNSLMFVGKIKHFSLKRA